MLMETYNKDIYNLKFRLKFYNMLTIIQGDSGIGKSFLFKTFQNESILGNINAICINCNDVGKINFEKIIDSATDKIIIIDNADILLNGYLRVKVSMDTTNQYIIFSHDTTGYKFADNGFARLVVNEGNVASLEYPLLEVV
jgi:ABC-type phosphate/phosphonate transport system ATPase subunit